MGGRWRRRIAVVAAVVAAIVAIAALVLVLAADRLAAWRTREALRRLDGYRATFETVDVRLRDLTYVVNDLRIAAERDGAMLEKVEVGRAEIALDPRALLSGDLVARVTLQAPSVRLVAEGGGAGKKGHRVRAIPLPAGVPDALLERVDVHDGRIVRMGAADQREWTLRLDAIEGSIENLATRPGLAAPGRTSLRMRARVQGSGDLEASVEADPAAERMTFSGSAELVRLDLTDISDLIAARSDFVPQRGSFRATLQVEADGGEIRGTVRTVVESPELSAEGDGLAAAAKGAIADLKIERHTVERKGERKQPALIGTFPIRGDVEGRARAIPTFLAIVAAGLARGLAEGLAIPPGSDEPTVVVPPRDRASSTSRR